MRRNIEMQPHSEQAKGGSARRWAGVVLMLLAGWAGWPAAVHAQNVQELRMTVGKSIVLDYPADVGRISTSNPDVVDAVAVTTREIMLHGKGQGISTLIIWSRAGERTFYNISVEQNFDPVRKLLKDTFPNEQIQVQASRDSLALVGSVSSQMVADRAAALSSTFAKTVVNNLRVAAAPVDQQIILRVKFGELNRSAVEQFGVNLLTTGALNTLGRVTTGQYAPPSASQLRTVSPSPGTGFTSEISLADMLNIFAFRPDLNLGVLIKALRERSLLQILAEPNIVTSDGKEAYFHVGGEFPVPVLQGGANAGAVTIQFREFGIRLLFQPQLTPNGTMKVHIRPEVSTVDYSNAVQLSGFTIPALSTRKMETNIELQPGQSFIIAGLIDDRVSEFANRIPGLANIPILGNFFRSRDTRKQKTELIVMVTPEIAHPVQPGEKTQPVFPQEFMPGAPSGAATTSSWAPPASKPPAAATPAAQPADGGPAAAAASGSRSPLRYLAGKFGIGGN
jgi:pilus assembly protein CpaC